MNLGDDDADDAVNFHDDFDDNVDNDKKKKTVDCGGRKHRSVYFRFANIWH